MAQSRGTTIKALADELDIHPSVIGKWCKQFLDTEDRQVLFSGNGNESLTPEQKQIKQLKTALKDKDLEVEILKKAISIFPRKTEYLSIHSNESSAIYC